MRGSTYDARLRTASIRPAWAILALTLAVVVAAAASAEAASLTLTWNAPTTNANGTPLTDLAGYRVYLGTSVPACPSGSFHSVSSSTSAPTAGQTVSTRIAGLTAAATYFVRVTAIDGAGNESGCSSSASGAAQPDVAVTPTGTTTFGSVAVNGTVDRIFTIQNTGSTSISVAVNAGSPFSVVSGGTFTLAGGASRNITVRFQPTRTGSFTGNVNFTAGGDTVSRAVSGSTTSTANVTLTVTKSGTGSGTVSSAPAGISCGNDCTQSGPPGTQYTLSATPASGSTFVGWGGACSGTGTCVATVNAATTVTATFNTAATAAGSQTRPVPVVASLSPASRAAASSGFTLTVVGSGFVNGSVVRWNGSSRATTFVSATQLRAAISAADLATVRTVAITVFTPAPGGGTSASRSFDVTGSSTGPSTPTSSTSPAAPSSVSASPRTVDATGVTFEVAWSPVAGATSYRWVAGFSDGSGGQQGSVTGLASFQLRMPYSASGAARGGFVCIRSVGGGGVQSTDQGCSALTVPARQAAPAPTPSPVPVVNGLSPSRVVAGSPGVTLTVNGSGFVAASVVRWDGADRPTTVVGTTQLRATIAAADIATARSIPVTVFTPTPGGGTSTVRSFVITAPPAAVPAPAPVPAPPPVPAPAPTPSTVPGMPGNPAVTLLGTGDTGATFGLVWSAAGGATSYQYFAAFADGSAAQQGVVPAPSMQLRMPYHRSGAAFGGFVCIRAANGAGFSADYACAPVPVPAR